MDRAVTAIIGVGPGNGAALARRFAAAEHGVALCARSLPFLEELAAELPGTRAFAYDAADPDRAEEVFDRIREELGPVTNLVYNAGAAVFGDIDALSFEQLQNAWAVNTGGLFQAVKSILPDLRAAAGDRRGAASGSNIVVMGATASLKGGAAFAAFASAKAGQRALAQSLARKLGPEGIHVSYVIVDGVIDIPRTRALLPDRPDEFFLQADAIAENVFHLTRQDRSAWTFELDLRPFAEKW